MTTLMIIWAVLVLLAVPITVRDIQLLTNEYNYYRYTRWNFCVDMFILLVPPLNFFRILEGLCIACDVIGQWFSKPLVRK